MDFTSVMDSVLEFRRDYPEAVSGILGVVGFLALFLIRKAMTSPALTPEATTLKSLLECKNRWRWGVSGMNTKRGIAGVPTGKSIICDGTAGQKVVALFANDKYTVDGEEIDLTRSDRRRLRVLRDAVVAHLTGIDDAQKAREQARARQARYNKLNGVA